MIYVLRNPEHPDKVLIGTPDWIARVRRERATGGFNRAAYGDLIKRDKGLPPWLRRLECVGMVEGDAAAAERLREDLWPATYQETSARYRCMPEDWESRERVMIPWRMMPPGWLGAIGAKPWDGTEAERLGVKGLGNARHRPPAVRVTSIADRVRRRRS